MQEMLSLCRKKRFVLCTLFIVFVITVLGFLVSKMCVIEETSAVSELPSLGNMVEVRFLNTQNNSSMTSEYDANESLIMKTYDNKYLLFDTGNNDNDIVNIIYNTLKDMQGINKVTLDYLVVSHLDSDHYGNVNAVLGHDNIKVKNVVVKYEKEFKSSQFRSIVANAARAEVEKIYTSSNVNSDNSVYQLFQESTYVDKDDLYNYYNAHKVVLTEGQMLQLGNFVKMYIYNTDDIYTNKECIEGYVVGWHSKIENLEADDYTGTSKPVKVNGNYIYFDGSNYPNIAYQMTPTILDQKTGGTRMDRYYYAYYDPDRLVNSCRSNANSYAILAEVTNSNANKYVYLTGDLENTGYDIKPVTTAGGAQIYGTGRTTFYDPNVDFGFSNGEITTNITPYKIASETNVSNSIKNKLGTNVNNIVIYQESHHGLNLSYDAVQILGINRASGVYAIAPTGDDPSRRNIFNATVGYYYSLGNMSDENKFYTGGYNDGVTCAITQAGAASCGYVTPTYTTKKLTYNDNGGSGGPGLGACTIMNNMGTGGTSCMTEVSSTAPTRSNYRFLGWADSATATTANYMAADYINLSSNKTVYAVWEELPDQTITFANGTSVNKTYGDADFTNIASTTGDGAITYNSNNTAVATVNSSTGKVHIVGAGTATITANAAATANYNAASKTYTLTVSKATQVVSFTNVSVNKTYGDADFTNVATTTGDGAITYGSNNEAVATVNSSTGKVHIVGAGTATITANAAATANYNAASTSYALTVAQHAATISFANVAVVKTYGDSPFSNVASTISDGTITYSSGDTSVATVNSSTGEVTIVKSGVVTITASVPATTDYTAASTTYELTVNKKASSVPEEVSEIKIGYMTDTLSTIELDTVGLVWEDDSMIIEEGNHVYPALYTENGDTNNYTTVPYEITVDGKRRNYTVIEGGEQTYILNNGEYASFVIDADYSLFENGGIVYVDENLLSSEYYNSESGSTIIKISNNYLATLSEGEHELSIYFNNGGVAKTVFTIARTGSEDDVSAPDTGRNIKEKEGTYVALIYILPIVMISVFVGFYICRERKQHRKFD